MKKGLSVMLAVCLCFACLLVASPAAYAQDARAMPVPFTFTDRVVLTPNLQDSFPLGTAEFDVTITGLYDAQGDHVYSIQSATCVYRGGINCTEHDMEVSTWTACTKRHRKALKLLDFLSVQKRIYAKLTPLTPKIQAHYRVTEIGTCQKAVK